MLGKLEKILVVDNSKKDREEIIKILVKSGYGSTNGYEIEETDCGTKAVEKARENKYHLITLNWVMGPISSLSDWGTKATIQIRKFDKETPILIISTGKDPLDVTEMGANAYVRKEYIEKTLPEALNQIYNL
jgi:CheY-like chemotaxis protein